MKSTLNSAISLIVSCYTLTLFILYHWHWLQLLSSPYISPANRILIHNTPPPLNFFQISYPAVDCESLWWDEMQCWKKIGQENVVMPMCHSHCVNAQKYMYICDTFFAFCRYKNPAMLNRSYRVRRQSWSRKTLSRPTIISYVKMQGYCWNSTKILSNSWGLQFFLINHEIKVCKWAKCVCAYTHTQDVEMVVVSQGTTHDAQ